MYYFLAALFSVVVLSRGVFCFFFQAEDGIRDLVRSRGLGDVYKRQELEKAKARATRLRNFLENFGSVNLGAQEDHERLPVSYTHLTLPTSDLV